MSYTQEIECDCCSHATPCNGSVVPALLRFTISYIDDGLSGYKYSIHVTLRWSPTACSSGLSPGWQYTGGDVDICPGFKLRAVNLCCISGSWALEVVVVNSGIQDDMQNPSFFANLTAGSASPLHLTTRSNGQYSTPCGFDFVDIDIADPSTLPPCCGSVDESATATLSWSYGGETGTVNLTRPFSGNTFTGTSQCSIGATGRLVNVHFEITCNGNNWTWKFNVAHIQSGTPATILSFAEWTHADNTGNIPATWALSCDPLHFHFQGGNTSGSAAGGASQACGGKTYQFAASGLTAILDAVTP